MHVSLRPVISHIQNMITVHASLCMHAGWLANVYEAGYCHNEEDDGCLRKCALLALELTK